MRKRIISGICAVITMLCLAVPVSAETNSTLDDLPGGEILQSFLDDIQAQTPAAPAEGENSTGLDTDDIQKAIQDAMMQYFSQNPAGSAADSPNGLTDAGLLQSIMQSAMEQAGLSFETDSDELNELLNPDAFKTILEGGTPDALTPAAPDPIPADKIRAAMEDETVDRITADALSLDRIPGISAAVTNGTDTFYKSWGDSDYKAQTPADENSVYIIGSLSKAFTAAAVMLLQEDGKLSVADNVDKYLPAFHVQYQGKDVHIKISHLLNHTSGIPNSTMKDIPEGTDSKWKEKEIRLTENMQLTAEPGTRFEYCNLGYDILAYLVETVSGQDFSEYVTEQILQPVGMTHSGYFSPPPAGYRPFFGKPKRYEAPESPLYGCGGLCTTAADMACWMKAMLGDLKLPARLQHALSITSVPKENMAETGERFFGSAALYYTNGWMIREDGGVLLHSGTEPAFTSMIYIDFNKHFGVFSVGNAAPLTGSQGGVTADAVYALLTDRPVQGQNIKPIMHNLPDRAAGYVILAAGILSLIVILLIVTQRARIDMKATKLHPFLEFLRMLRRVIMYAVPLVLLLKVPDYLGYSLHMISVWLPQTVTIALVMLCVLLGLCILGSVYRFAVIVYMRAHGVQ